MSRYEEVLSNYSPCFDCHHTGLNLADATLFIACATSLSVLLIKKHVEDGKEITPILEQNDGSIW